MSILVKNINEKKYTTSNNEVYLELVLRYSHSSDISQESSSLYQVMISMRVVIS